MLPCRCRVSPVIHPLTDDATVVQAASGIFRLWASKGKAVYRLSLAKFKNSH